MGDYEAQVRALDEGALVRALPELGALEVTGEDRLSWLGGLFTSDLAKLCAGEGSYSLSVDKTGRVQADAWVLVDEDRVFLGVASDRVETLRETLDHYLIMEDAEIAPPSAHWSWWLAHGPEASAVARAALAVGALAARTTLGRCPTAIIAAPPEADHNLAEILTGPSGALLATPAAWERIRVERLLPAFGVDFSPGAYPQEASLEDLAVSFDKGCYLGQEAVFMLQKRGKPPRRLVPIAIEGEALPEPQSSVETPDGSRIGTLGTAVRVGSEIRALATLKHKYSDIGSEIRVEGRIGRVVAPLPGFR